MEYSNLKVFRVYLQKCLFLFSYFSALGWWYHIRLAMESRLSTVFSKTQETSRQKISLKIKKELQALPTFLFRPTAPKTIERYFGVSGWLQAKWPGAQQCDKVRQFSFWLIRKGDGWPPSFSRTRDQNHFPKLSWTHHSKVVPLVCQNQNS